MARLLDCFSGLTVAVVGDVLYDGYLEGRARGLCREAPVPVVRVRSRAEAAGGAANVAVNLAALGADVRLLSVVGTDDAAARVLDIAHAHRVDTEHVVVSRRRRTPAKRRILADGHMLVRFDEGTEAPLDRDDERRLARAVARQTRDADAVIASDYGMGVITEAVAQSVQVGPPLIVDAKDPRRFRSIHPIACAPNFDEVAALLGGFPAGSAGDRARAVTAAADRILAATGAAIVAVTIDADGAVVLERERPAHRVYADRVPERSSAGAGDTFTAALTLGLLACRDAATAAEIAAAAAGVVVGKDGTATCSSAELRVKLLPGGKVVADAAALAGAGERHRREGRRIVLANGCFDILHRGHVALLNAAKTFGDVLVVAVNGDDSVRRLKGPSRPVNSLADRIEVLAALSCVDHIVAFHDDRPAELIRALRPDVLVKGGDYTEDGVPEAALVRALGGEVRIVERIADRSTSGTLERLRAGPAR
jgi:rfaE bifunctional protein kinase chain/domain/rfaE bifunctional protein nucleotidyltransferase chain/domain